MFSWAENARYRPRLIAKIFKSRVYVVRLSSVHCIRWLDTFSCRKCRHQSDSEGLRKKVTYFKDLVAIVNITLKIRPFQQPDFGRPLVLSTSDATINGWQNFCCNFQCKVGFFNIFTRLFLILLVYSVDQSSVCSARVSYCTLDGGAVKTYFWTVTNAIWSRYDVFLRFWQRLCAMFWLTDLRIS